MFHPLAKYLLIAALGAGLLLPQTPVFRTKVSLVRVVATVKNQSGGLVGTLQKDDFEIYDNGVRQTVANFNRQTAQPLSVALMIDTSGSTNKDLKYETDSAARFFKALLSEGNPEDAVALFSFNDSVVKEHDFTHNYTSLEARLKYLKGSAGTSLYDAIYLGAQALEKREGRKVMVIISDGGNTTSSTQIHPATREAQMADAVLYPVLVMPITNVAGRNIGGEHSLQYMAENTGGRMFLPQEGKLDQVFADIILELRTQYLLGYYPQGLPLTKEPYHKLEVRVKNPDLRVSARSGYYGDAEGMIGSSDNHVTVTPNGRKKRSQQ